MRETDLQVQSDDLSPVQTGEPGWTPDSNPRPRSKKTQPNL